MIRTPNDAWTTDRVSHDYVADYKPFSMVDGEGVRCSLYVSGCLFDCSGCFNKAAQSFRYGTLYSDELEGRIITDLAQPYVQGLSLLGGEPFLNTGVCLRLVKRVRQEFGRDKDIWCWSGYTFEQLLNGSQDKQLLLDKIDVLIDGPFRQEEKDLSLAFRGSRNQRVLNVLDSILCSEVISWSAHSFREGNRNTAH